MLNQSEILQPSAQSSTWSVRPSTSPAACSVLPECARLQMSVCSATAQPAEMHCFPRHSQPGGELMGPQSHFQPQDISHTPQEYPHLCPSQLAPTMFTAAAHMPRYFHPLPAAPHTAHIALLDDGSLMIFFFRRDSHMLAVCLQNAFLKTESKGSPAPRKLFHH